MGTITLSAEHRVGAPVETVYGYLADMREHHHRFLPSAFSDFEVQEGGVGDGTIVSYKVTAGGRSRAYRMKVTEPDPGRILTESDMESSLRTTFTVLPEQQGSRVRISTEWEGAGGIGGIFERLFAPRVMRRIYAEELDLLDAYVRRQAETTGPSA